MRVVLFQPFPDSYRQSMRVYADELLKGIQPHLTAAESIGHFLPEGVRLAPKLARWWSQYIRYPREARAAQGDVNHVIDQAYSHLLYSLDPERTVVTFHDAIALKTDLGLIQNYNLRGLCRAAAVICDSEASRKDLLRFARYPEEKTAVIHAGVSDSFSQEPQGNPWERVKIPPGRYLLHVGHNKAYKNIPGLLEIFSILRQSKKMPLQLLKVGEGLTPSQQALAEKLGLKDQIVSLGRVPPQELPALYHCAELLLIPSWDEGFGLPVLESMASGTPVAASERGALPEVVGEAGLLFNPEDTSDAADRIASLLEDPGRCQRLKEAGLQRAREFTWDKTARQTLEVYRKVYQASRR